MYLLTEKLNFSKTTAKTDYCTKMNYKYIYEWTGNIRKQKYDLLFSDLYEGLVDSQLLQELAVLLLVPSCPLQGCPLPPSSALHLLLS
jgi:hypothetical protein